MTGSDWGPGSVLRDGPGLRHLVGRAYLSRGAAGAYHRGMARRSRREGVGVMFDWLDRDAVAALVPDAAPVFHAGLGYGFAIDAGDDALAGALCFGAGTGGSAALWFEWEDGTSAVVFDGRDPAALADLFGRVLRDFQAQIAVCSASDSGLSVRSCWCAECAEIRAGVSA